jgi:Carboxypeptidase regulatory-like domain
MKLNLLPAALLLGAFAFPVNSQQPLVGSIEGTIRNQQKAVIPYASLTATNIDSVERESDRRTTAADKQGFYQFVNVPEGRYSIVVRMKGYEDFTVPLLTLRGSQKLKMPVIKMSPAETEYGP